MRTNANVQTGQVWRSSDPRRLSAFEVVGIYGDLVMVQNVFPRTYGIRYPLLAAFQITGPKGYTRVS